MFSLNNGPKDTNKQYNSINSIIVVVCSQKQKKNEIPAPRRFPRWKPAVQDVNSLVPERAERPPTPRRTEGPSLGVHDYGVVAGDAQIRHFGREKFFRRQPAESYIYRQVSFFITVSIFQSIFQYSVQKNRRTIRVLRSVHRKRQKKKTQVYLLLLYVRSKKKTLKKKWKRRNS